MVSKNPKRKLSEFLIKVSRVGINMNKYMKKKRPLIQLILLLQFSITICAQESKNNLVVSGMLAHYEQISKYGSAEVVPGYYQYPVDPGIEFLYLRNLNKNISLGTGIGYQKGRIMDFIINQYRFHFAELSIPILFNTHLYLNEKNGLLISAGLYGGKTILLKAESTGSTDGWYEFSDFDISWYSDDSFFLDIYFGAGYSYSISQKSSISIMPFVKYRANTVWLNDFQKKLHYGIKLSYSVDL